MDNRKTIVIITAFVFVLVLTSLVSYKLFQRPHTMVVEAKGQIKIGNPSAPIELIVIEDFRCPTCGRFTTQIFPKIEADYVKSGSVRVTFVPVAFLSGSKPIANAVLEVYQDAPKQVIAFVHRIFTQSLEGPVSDAALLRIARQVGEIDAEKLQRCMATRCHYEELEENLQWAHNLMGKEFGTPSLYINGTLTSATSYPAIQARIDQLLLGRR